VRPSETRFMDINFRPNSLAQERLSESAALPPLQRHYTVDEVAALWQLSRDTVRRLFQDEPGVLTIDGVLDLRISINICIPICQYTII
jgi:hypothetical protein